MTCKARLLFRMLLKQNIHWGNIKGLVAFGTGYIIHSLPDLIKELKIKTNLKKKP